MDEGGTTGRTPLLGQVLAAWGASDGAPTWNALRVRLGGLAESVCLVTWSSSDGDAVIAQAGAQAILALGAPLAGQPVEALTPGRADAANEAARAREASQPFTVEDEVGVGGKRRIARLYLPLNEHPPTVACAVVRVD
jgi:hypothetical protein